MTSEILTHDNGFFRPIRYILNSRTDFYDLWLSLLFVFNGLSMYSGNILGCSWFYGMPIKYGGDHTDLSIIFLILRCR